MSGSFKPHRWAATVLIAVPEEESADPDLGLPTLFPHVASPVFCYDCGLEWAENVDGVCSSPAKSGYPAAT